MNPSLRILILEDLELDFQLMNLVLQRDGLAFTPRHALGEADFLEYLEQFAPEVVLADYRLPGYDGLAALEVVRQRHPNVPVIMVSGEMGEERAIEALNLGATDYVLKTNLNRLGSAVRRAARGRQEQLELQRTQETLHRAHEELEQRVKDRTAELELANARLQQEIEQHKRTVEELRDSRTLLTTVFASLAAHVTVLDRTGTLLAVNEGWTCFAETGAGPGRGVAPGANYLEVCRRAAARGDATGSLVEAGILAVVEGQQPEYSLEYPSGSGSQRRWFRMLVTPLKRPEGGVLVAHTDITQYRLAELQVQRLSQDLEHFGRVSMAGELAMALAHELRQPLTAILSNAEAASGLLEGTGVVDMGEAREILTDIAASGQRAGEVIRRLRSLLRKGQAEMQPLQLNDLIGEVLPLVRNQALLHEVVLTAELAPTLPLTHGDRIQLEQVLMNLLLNALTALKSVPRPQRRLLIRTTQPDAQHIQLSVRDSGSGIPAAQLAHIFDSFFSTKAEGLGMGLSICQSVVQAHGGRIWATNNPEGGATLHCLLPTGPSGPEPPATP
jgi:signal transduction histidine kinase/CheY-like chemotaxis protein